MSWQLGVLAILLGGLAAGVAWYERGRPDARIVALVATLAALAALGRIAFAALPNVKPSTDIVLVAGYALGPAPGFMVGALCGLASNFFFGQGPWTAWQMAAWAATGAGGAGLAVLTRGRIGRWPLAIVCAAVGFVFAAVQDAGDWVTFSDHSAAQLGVYVGKGVGFDLVHAGGCLVFALLFGPALLRSLERFTRRLEVRWLSPGGALVPVLAALVAGAALGAPARAAVTPTGYLLAAENTDGGYGPAAGQGSSALFAGWAALGLASVGMSPADVHRGGATLLAYVASQAGLTDPGSIERTILVARAAGADPSHFGGHDLLGALRRRVGSDGAVADQVNLTVFAMLALRAAGNPVSPRTLNWLVRQQNTDGGFGFTAGGTSDPDDTGAALEALASAGAPARTLARGVAYLRAAQNPDGGLPAQGGGESDAQSTAWAVQGLLAAGADPAGLRRSGSPTPLDYLRSLIAADGHVRYARGTDQTPVWVTGEALMALARRSLPLTVVVRSRGVAPTAPSRLARAAGRRIGTRGAGGGSRPAAGAVLGAPGPPPRGHRPPPRGTGARASEALFLGALAAPDAQAIMSALERLLAPFGLAVPSSP